MNKLLIVFVLLAVFLFADASKCRISRGKAGVVKRCRLSGRRVSVRKCKITSIKGRVAKVCCSKRARIVRRRRASTRRVRRVRRVRRTRRVRRLRFLRRKVRKVRVSRKVVKRVVKRVVTRTIRKIKVIRRKDRKRVKKAVKKAIARALRRKRNVRIAIRRTIRRIVKKIVIRARRPRVSGPAKCAAGQILKFTKTGKRSIKRECVAAKPVSETKVCYGWGDPHYKSENGKTFDNYKQGVWVFAKSEDGVYEVQTTNGLSRAWGTNAVVQRSAIKINGIDIFGINAKTKSVLLNFEALNLKIGQTKMLAAGGAIKRVSAQQYELLSPNGIRTLIDFVWLNVNDYYTNIYTYASADIASQITGFCHGNQNVSPAAGRSYFAKKFVAKVAGKARSWTPKLKAAARAFCAKVAKKQRRQCYRDYRVGGRKLAESAIIIKKDLKKLRNINVNLVKAVLRGKKTVRKPRVYGAKSCPAGQQLRFRKTRRGLKASCRKASTKPEKQCYSVGDPHLMSTERLQYDYQHSGDFLFAQSKGKTFEVQVRQGASPMWRGATLNHRVAVKVNGYDVITLSGKTGTLRVNHKAVQLSPGQSYQFKLGGAIKRLNQQQFEVVGLNGYRSVFSYHIVNAQNYYINLYAYSNGGANLTGLCASKPGVVPPRVPSSLFTKTFIKRRVGKLPKWGRGKKRAAKRLCRHLKGAAKRSCIFDFRVGGKRLAKSDLHVKRNLRLIKRKAHWIRRVARAIRVRL